MKKVIVGLIYSGLLHAGGFFDAKEKVLFEDNSFSSNQQWLNLGKTKEESIRYLIESLAKSQTGKKILSLGEKKAKDFGQTLLDIINVGEKSLTDTTLLRKFSEKDEHVIIFESKSKIFIDKNLGLKEAILDLAHELTHFSLRLPFNPYSSSFSAKEFIVSTVEGRGGEVEAFLVECSVFRDLFPRQDFLRSTCNKVIDLDSGRIIKKKGIEQFYRVGEFFEPFKKEMENHGLNAGDFPLLKADKAIFYSSAYAMPYPLAALKEFESVQKKVCENNKNRLNLYKGTNLKLSATLKKNFESQCQKFSHTTFVDLN
jgi:hypothetical protein